MIVISTFIDGGGIGEVQRAHIRDNSIISLGGDGAAGNLYYRSFCAVADGILSVVADADGATGYGYGSLIVVDAVVVAADGAVGDRHSTATDIDAIAITAITGDAAAGDRHDAVIVIDTVFRTADGAAGYGYGTLYITRVGILSGVVDACGITADTAAGDRHSAAIVIDAVLRTTDAAAGYGYGTLILVPDTVVITGNAAAGYSYSAHIVVDTVLTTGNAAAGHFHDTRSIVDDTIIGSTMDGSVGYLHRTALVPNAIFFAADGAAGDRHITAIVVDAAVCAADGAAGGTVADIQGSIVHDIIGTQGKGIAVEAEVHSYAGADGQPPGEGGIIGQHNVSVLTDCCCRHRARPFGIVGDVAVGV